MALFENPKTPGESSAAPRGAGQPARRWSLRRSQPSHRQRSSPTPQPTRYGTPRRSMARCRTRSGATTREAHGTPAGKRRSSRRSMSVPAGGCQTRKFIFPRLGCICSFQTVSCSESPLKRAVSRRISWLYARNSQGRSFPVRVHEIKEDIVIVDFNHPLAGKTLLFDVKILNIQASESK